MNKDFNIEVEIKVLSKRSRKIIIMYQVPRGFRTGGTGFIQDQAYPCVLSLSNQVVLLQIL